MHPRKKRSIRTLPQPAERVIDDVASGPLSGVDARRELVLRQVEVVVVRVEALRDSPSAIQHERPDEPAGAIAVRLQHFGERDLIVADVELSVVADAVKGRKRAGEQ